MTAPERRSLAERLRAIARWAPDPDDGNELEAIAGELEAMAGEMREDEDLIYERNCGYAPDMGDYADRLAPSATKPKPE